MQTVTRRRATVPEAITTPTTTTTPSTIIEIPLPPKQKTIVRKNPKTNRPHSYRYKSPLQ